MQCNVSIIIPVYNCESTINRCIDSLLLQTYKNFNLIVIDDGSSDNTLNCLKKYKENNKVKIVIQENMGVSTARNQGLLLAEGDYICFVDADDYVEKTYLEDLINGLNSFNGDIDMAVVNIMNKDLDGNLISKSNYNDGIKSHTEFVSQILDYTGPQGYLWNKIFKLPIIKKYKITFDTNLSICEDLLFCINYLEHARYVNVLNSNDYNYINDPMSLTGSMQVGEQSNLDRWLDYLKAFELINKKVKNNVTAKLNCETRIVQASLTIIRIMNIKKIKEQCLRKELKQKIDKYKISFKNSTITTKKQKIIFHLYEKLPFFLTFVDRAIY